MSEKNDVRCVTRFEAIDPLARRLGVRSNIEAHFQDDGQTLKVFVPVEVKLGPEDQCLYEGERPASDVEVTSLVKSTLEDLKVDRAAGMPKTARFSMYTAVQLDAV